MKLGLAQDGRGLEGRLADIELTSGLMNSLGLNGEFIYAEKVCGRACLSVIVVPLSSLQMPRARRVNLWPRLLIDLEKCWLTPNHMAMRPRVGFECVGRTKSARTELTRFRLSQIGVSCRVISKSRCLTNQIDCAVPLGLWSVPHAF